MPAVSVIFIFLFFSIISIQEKGCTVSLPSGDSGRIVDYADIRELPQITTAKEIRARGMHLMSVNRHAEFIPNEDEIDNQLSLRPHLMAKRLVIPVMATANNSWQTIAVKKEYRFE